LKKFVALQGLPVYRERVLLFDNDSVESPKGSSTGAELTFYI